jgi:hypothetical protein
VDLPTSKHQPPCQQKTSRAHTCSATSPSTRSASPHLCRRMIGTMRHRHCGLNGSPAGCLISRVTPRCEIRIRLIVDQTDVGTRRRRRARGWRACGGVCAGVLNVGTKGRKMAVAGQRLMQQAKVKLIQKECSNLQRSNLKNPHG